MPISDDDRQTSLIVGAELMDLDAQAQKDAQEMKQKYPDLPREMVEYIDASTRALHLFITTLVQQNEKLLMLDDALLKEMQKNA
jgi:hypothetical protein